MKDLDGNPADKVPVSIRVGTSYSNGDILDKKVIVANGVFDIDVPIPPFKHNKIYLNVSYFVLASERCLFHPSNTIKSI